MADENTAAQPVEEPAGGQAEQPASPPAETPPAEAAPVAQAAAAPAAAEAQRARKDMSPEERAAAIKAAQERALAMKAERDAAKAAAAGTAVAPVADGAVVAAAPAGPVWRIPAAGAQQVTIARPEARAVAVAEQSDRQVKVLIQRRQFLRGGVFASLGGLVILMVGSFLNLFNPRHIVGFGGVVKVPASNIPKPGADPVKIFEGKFWLVNLKEGEGGAGAIPGSPKGGLVALYQKCPHLGCSVPWRPDFDFEGSKGWFRCPCHGSTYTEGGLKVAGPAPRSMDTMALTVNADGSVTVNTGKITLGASPSDPVNDPQRAV